MNKMAHEFVSSSSKSWLLLPVAPLIGSGGILYSAYHLVQHGGWLSALVIGGTSGALIGFYLRTRGKFGVVTVNDTEVRVWQDGHEHRFSWRDVKSFRRLPLLNPIIYEMTFEESKLVTCFVPKSIGRLFLGMTFDATGMGKFIRKRLREVRGIV